MNQPQGREPRKSSGRRGDAAKPWYLNLNTWVGAVIGLAFIGTFLVIGLTLLLMTQGQNPSPAPPMLTADSQTPGGVVAAWDTPPPGGMGSASGPAIEAWNGTERFTVLVMGLDRRPGEIGTGFRTDTMILISIDPASQSLGMLSIPRDLFVVVPGYEDRHRVNEALSLGELQQLGFGPQLAMQTVQLNFGIVVHDYATVDFNVFVRLVDELGGIDIEAPKEIYDPYYPDHAYGYDPFYIAAGPQHMDGTTALKYARTRYTTSDFDRARRQQQVIYAIRDKILDPGVWPSLITQAPALWQEISSGVQTGLDFGAILSLAMYLKDISGEKIHSGVVDQHYAADWITPQGAMVLIPDQASLAGLMVEVFGPTYSQQ